MTETRDRWDQKHEDWYTSGANSHWTRTFCTGRQDNTNNLFSPVHLSQLFSNICTMIWVTLGQTKSFTWPDKDFIGHLCSGKLKTMSFDNARALNRNDLPSQRKHQWVRFQLVPLSNSSLLIICISNQVKEGTNTF